VEAPDRKSAANTTHNRSKAQAYITNFQTGQYNHYFSEPLFENINTFVHLPRDD